MHGLHGLLEDYVWIHPLPSTSRADRPQILDTVALISTLKVRADGIDSPHNVLTSLVDDMFLVSDIYSPAGTTYQVTTADLAQHKTWVATVNTKLPTGSSYFIEIAHNGNGNIEVFICNHIWYPY